MLTDTKQYKINKRWGINCKTYKDYVGNKYYDVEVIMLDVPWQEVVDCRRNITDSRIANSIFKEFVAKYKRLDY